MTQANTDPLAAKMTRIGIAAWLVILIWALYPYTYEPAGPIKEFVLRFGAASLFFLAVLGSNFDLRPRDRVLPVLVLSFVALSGLSILWAVNTWHSVFEWTRLAALGAIFYTARYAYRTADQLLSAIAVIAAAMAVSAVYGFVQFLGWDPMPWDMAVAEEFNALQQGPSTFGNPNYASHALVLAIVLTSAWAYARRSISSIVALLLFVAHFALTQTRGSLLALGCAAVFVCAAVVLRGRTPNPKVQIWVTLGVTAVLLAAGSASFVLYSMARFAAPIPYDPTVAIRVQTLAGATEMIRERPLKGWGPGSYVIENPRFWTDDEQRRFAEEGAFNAHVHSDLVETAIDSGLFATALLIAMFVVGLVYALRMALSATERSERAVGFALAASVVALSVDSFFGFPLHTPVAAVLAFLMLGALSGFTLRKRRGEARSNRWARAVQLAAALALLVIEGGTISFLFAEHVKQRGRGAMAAGATAYAVEQMKAASKWMPSDWESPYLCATALAATSQPDEALEWHGKCLQLNPNYVYAYIESAKIHLHLATTRRLPDQLLLAIEKAESAAKLSPYDSTAQDLLGRAYAVQAQWANEASDARVWWAKAEEYLRRAAEDKVNARAQSWRLIAEARRAQGDTGGMLDALFEALQLDPAADATWERLETYVAESEDTRPLLNAVGWRLKNLREEGRVAGAEVAKLHVWHATALELSPDSEDAIQEAFEAAILAMPNRTVTWEAYFDWAEETDQLEGFTALLKRIADNRARHNETLPFGLAAAGVAVRDNDAEAALSQLAADCERSWNTTELDAVRAGFRVSAGYLLNRFGATLSAGDLKTIGHALLIGDDAERAIETLTLAAERGSGAEKIDALLEKAVALTVLERPADAVSTLEEASRLDFRRLDARLALAAAYAANDQPAQARLEYMAVLNALPPADPLRERVSAALDRIEMPAQP